MTLKTRGSTALDKAQRRLALMKGIDENLDLGHGLTVEGYSLLIDEVRSTLEDHNRLLSEVEESRKTVAQLDRTLSDLSARMLSGVATRYGKDSIQYAKAGGSNRKRKSKKAAADAVSVNTGSASA